jgi:hypothetical protein
MPPLVVFLITEIQGRHFISTTATLFSRLPLYLNYATPEVVPYYPNSGLPLYFNDCHFI